MSETSTKKPTNSKADKTKKIFKKVSDYLKRLKTVDPQHILAGATIALVLIGWYQACKVKQSLEVSNKAYVSVAKIATNMNEFFPYIIFINTGQTPAYDVKVGIKLELCKNESELSAVNKFQLVKKALVLGKDKTINPIWCIRQNVPKDTLAMVNSGEIKVFLHGRVTYTDIFKNNRFLNFRYIVSDDPSNSEGAIDFAKNGNSTDRN